jgi:hypothetical protein
MQDKPRYCGCILCGRPTLEDHTLCDACEMDKRMSSPSAILYEFPSGKRIEYPKRKTLTLKSS